MRWWLFPAFGVVVAFVYSIEISDGVTETAFAAASVASVLAVLVGVRNNRPARPLAWYLIAAGSALWALGDSAYLSVIDTATPTQTDAVSTLSIADFAYLLGYPVLALGLYLLVHRRARRGELGHVANSAIVAIAFGLLMWVFIVRPTDDGVARAAGVVGVAYPAMDVFLLGLLVHFIGSRQWRTASFRLLICAVMATLLGDIAIDVLPIATGSNGTYVSGFGYLVFYVLVGTAALHPTMSTLTPPTPGNRNLALAASFSTPTIVVLTAAILTAPAAMAILLVRGEDVAEWGWGVVLCSTLLVALVFIRVSELLALLRRQTETLRGAAETDLLTSLPNRNGLEQWVERQWFQDLGQWDEQRTFTILVLDIDRFKDINDTLGHNVGDEVLRAVAARLHSAVGDHGKVGRVGADEFAVVCDVGSTDAVTLAQDMHAALAHPVDVRGVRLLIEASIGIASSEFADTAADTTAHTHAHAHDADVDDVAPETIGRRAYLAMSFAKHVQPRIALYESTMDRDESGQLLLLSELSAAMGRQELEVYYQVQVGLSTMSVVGVEALLRWNHPERGLLEPDAFLPMAERTTLIRPLLGYVLAEALSQRQLWSAEGVDLTVSINISARNLLDATLVDQVRLALAEAGADADVLTVEITETASITDLPVAVDSLDRLRALGVGLAIDDYGTGYSSLAYLQRLPVQQLKIDRSFVTDMTTTAAHGIIVRSTIDLARTLGLTVTAEGVEDRATLMELKRLSCNFAQGYHLGRPVPASQIPRSATALDAELREYTEAE